jgi:histone H3/H4
VPSAPVRLSAAINNLVRISTHNGRIAADARLMLEELITNLVRAVTTEAIAPVSRATRRRLQVADVAAVIQRVDANLHAHGLKTVERYRAAETVHDSREIKAGVTFPIVRMQNMVRQTIQQQHAMTSITHMEKHVPVYMAGIMNQLVVRLLSMSDRIVTSCNRKTITETVLHTIVDVDPTLQQFAAVCLHSRR